MKKLDEFLLKESTFILLIMGAAAAIFAGTFMYIRFGVGAFNDISIVQMLKDGLGGGDYAAAAGFAAGFLIARVLEGPLVGLLDIGGSLQTGIGIGIPALLLSTGIMFPFDNIVFALGSGAFFGLVIGALIIGIRKLVPDGISVGGTSIMMGAGNATGTYLGPLVVISACQAHIYLGFGSIIGAALFYKYNKSTTGGAIIGSMLMALAFMAMGIPLFPAA